MPRTYYNIILLFTNKLFPHFPIYKYHPVAWDDCCAVRFKGLHLLLTKLWLDDPKTGLAEIERILNYPSQHEEGLLASTIVTLRQMATSPLDRLTDLANRLPEGKKGYLAQTPRLRELVGELSRQYLLLTTVNRAYMRQVHHELLVSKITEFKYQVRGFEYPLAQEAEKAADQWLVQASSEQPRQTHTAQAVPDVFYAGNPVDADQEPFIHRLAAFENLERQLNLATGCPGVVLYGRRRIGKSTLLHNLPLFLPDHFHLLSWTMQDPAFFTSLPVFLANLTQLAKANLPADISVPDKPPTDLPGLSALLAAWDAQLGPKRRILLCLDEYEMIDRKIAEGVFPENLLDTFRQATQSHRHIIWLFAGSHRIEELSASDWTSRLISAKTLTLDCFSADETRLLLTDPLGRSPSWSKRPERPDLTDFWAEGHLDRVYHETGGWPYFVQHLAQTLVDLANDRGVQQTSEALFEAALDRAAEEAHTTLHQLLVAETQPDERAYLKAFVSQPVQPLPPDPDLQYRLERLDLVLETEGGYRLRVPLMARWMKRNRL